jgi:membrane protein
MAKFNFREVWSFTKQMFSEFADDNVMSRAAALAYYTIFSLAPILVIIITAAGFFFGREALEGQLFGQLEGLMGAEAAAEIQEMVASVSKSGSGTVATILSVITLIFGATGVFNELKLSLNQIWDLKSKPKNGMWALVRDRLLSFSVVLSLGFVLLVALVINAGIAVLGDYITSLVPQIGEVTLQVFNFLISVGITSLLFAVIFKMLPDVHIKFADVWKGALFTAILFAVGKILIGIYIGQSDVGGAYGAAGSLIVILVWVYYSSVILFLGAEFTFVYAQRYGDKIMPNSHAVHIRTIEEPAGTVIDNGAKPHRPYSQSPQYTVREKNPRQ